MISATASNLSRNSSWTCCLVRVPDAETHPWMDWDRYHTAEEMLRDASDDFDVQDCFAVLKAFSQEVCPTVVSMVYGVAERTACWCENRNWEQIEEWKL